MTSPLEENEVATFRFVVVNIDSADIIGGVYIFSVCHPPTHICA